MATEPGKLRAEPSSSAWENRRWPWSVVVALALVLLVALSLRKFFGIDEFLYLHWGSEAAQGRFAGADYFAMHFSLLQFVLAPLFLLLDPSSAAPMMASRGIALILFLAAVAAAVSTIDGRQKRALGAALLLSTNVLITAAVEVRPDVLSLSLFCCGCVLYLRTRTSAAAVGAGLLLGCAILSSEKALLHGVAFALTLAFSLRRASRESRMVAEFRRALLCAGATATVLGATVVALWKADGLHQLRLWLEFAHLHETAYPAEKLAGLKQISGLLVEAPLLVLAPFGAFHLLRRALRTQDSLQAQRDCFVALAGIMGIIAVVVQKAPYQYSCMPFLLFGTLWTVEALDVLAVAARKNFSRVAAWRCKSWGAVVVLAFLLGELHKTFEDLTRRENTPQLAALETLFRITTPADCVYDNSAIAFSRRHADDFFVTTDATMRMANRKALSQRIPAAIRERECAVFVKDGRSHDLSRSLGAFLRSHYVPIADDILIWGREFPAGSTSVLFEAIQAGDYYIWPESARFRAGKSILALPKGESTIDVVAPASFFILWLPRDRTLYPPSRNAAGHGPFSAESP